ncbi:NAD(P)H-dependent oxidoreductase [Mycolicibacterium goodii]|uniref:FMN dependent NADH:quinone oxidoreductase n=1 Tax=Mycolicibacterium goodii TaxID=134601 RepID=A0A0K0X901_MYCGD|nr:ACP phosphodieterase [Mycolicibacterium goodii]
MPYILQLDSSANLSSSVSRSLTGKFAQRWAAGAGNREIRRRDLHVDALPHLPTNALHFTADTRPEDAVAPAASAVELQAALVAELSEADAVVIGAPMYNFSMPSTLKAWLDYVHVIGETSPAAEGVCPLRGKRVAVVSSRATPTGEDPRADFVLGPFFTILGEFMAMDVEGFVVHGEPPAADGDFHRAVADVEAQLLDCADRWS